MNTRSHPTILAHRGGSAHAPENTLASFARGLAEGADGFELDVHLSKEGVPVVIHDFTVERVAGPKEAISALTVHELHSLDVGSWFAPEYADQYVPTLEEVLALVQGREIVVNIEVKAGYRVYPGIEEKCLALVAALGRETRIVFSSFDHYCLRRLREIDSTAVTGALYGCSLIDAHEYAARIGVDALHPQYQVVNAELVAGCRQKGIHVNTWTVNDPGQARRLRDLGVNAIITDDPRKIRAALENDAP
jgi:glycerophosphoryl diester phosphodiesterase